MNKVGLRKRLLPLMTAVILISACGMSEEKARKQLGRMNIEYTRVNFIEKVKEGNTVVVKLFLQAGIDVNAKDDKDGWPALMLASYYGQAETVSALIKAGADINAKKFGYTALMTAAKNGYTEIVSALIKAGADVNAKDENGGTAVMEAAWNGSPEIVSALIKAGADVNVESLNRTPLMLASYSGQAETVSALIKAGANVNAKDKEYGKTALKWAADGCHVDEYVTTTDFFELRERVKNSNPLTETIDILKQAGARE